MNMYLERATRLHKHLYKTHWTGGGLEGPDPGVRFNARIGRFVKNFLKFIPWGERYYYLQAQGYWIHSNWMLYDLLGDEKYKEIAIAGSHQILERQTPEGYWQYPFPEWSGRVATVEGCYASLGMLHTYRRTGDKELAAGVARWYAYLKKEIGFRQEGEMLSVQYFARMEELAKNKLANIQLGRCPNNSTLLVMMTGEAYDATKDESYLEYRDGMLAFLRYAQTPEGKFPYIVPYKEHPGKDHYLCFQYNAFQLLDLARYHEVTGDQSVLEMLHGLARFLSKGVAPDGSSKYDSFHDTPFIPYYTGVLGAALDRATDLGIADYRELSDRVYGKLLSVQRKNGSFTFSHKNYGFLSDGRSYPRPQCMILKHLIMRAKVVENRKRSNGAQARPQRTGTGVEKN